MPLKYNEPGEDISVVRRWDHGLTWMAHPDALMRRASHALVLDGDVWLVDPLDAAGLEEEIATLGDVAGVVVLTNSHGRHADRLAARHDVAVHVPACFDEDDHPVSGFSRPVELFEDELGDSDFELVWEKASPGWQEGALYHPDRRTLVIPDTLMTALFTGKEGRLEVMPFFRFSPPRAELGELVVKRILVGHGEPVFENAQTALDEALSGAHRSTPGAIIRSLPTFARQMYSEIRV